MIVNEYLEKFIIKQIQRYVPEGVHHELHINCQAEMFEIIMKLMKNGEAPMKISVVVYLCTAYRDILYQKYSTLN